MIDTLATFPARDEICLILGADAALGLPGWKRWEEIVDRVHLAVAARPGSDLVRVEQIVGRSPIRLDIPRLDISSDQIRRLLRAGRSIRFLVPDSVREYIAENELYRADNGL